MQGGGYLLGWRLHQGASESLSGRACRSNASGSAETVQRSGAHHHSSPGHVKLFHGPGVHLVVGHGLLLAHGAGMNHAEGVHATLAGRLSAHLKDKTGKC